MPERVKSIQSPGIFPPVSRSCGQCGAPAAEEAAFCAACGAPLSDASPAERRLATIVFADLVGSTELISGRDPEEIRELLAPFFELAREALERRGGRVEKFIGDAVVGVFGVPRAHGDDPDRAVDAALSLVATLSERAPALRVRVGVETGEVLASTGSDLALAGDAASAAARLQAAADAGEVRVGARCASACRSTALEPTEPVVAKGFTEPLRAWRALSARPAGRRPSSPFLGRSGELEALRFAFLDAARGRVPRLALVVGDAGAGKTRLVRELLSQLVLEDPAPIVLTGRNPPYGEGIAFWALAEVLRGAAGAAADATGEAVRNGLERRLAELEVSGARVTANELASAVSGSQVVPEVATLRRAWRVLLAALAGSAPVVLAIDDIHWADEGFLELVEDAISLPDGPVFVVATARPEISVRRPDLVDDERRESLALGPLPGPAARELAASLVEGDRDLASKIADASGGNPFFAEEIAHALGTSGDPLRTPPDTVQAVIAARLDALTADQKRTLQRAAVLGDRFRRDALEELLEDDPDGHLRSLEAGALVEDRGRHERGLYQFRHQLIREVAYATVPRSERARLHQRAAASVRARAGGRYAELSEVIAFHLARAAELDAGDGGALQRAFDASAEAAGLARSRGAVARAQDLYEQAGGLEVDPQNRIHSLLAAAEIALSRARGHDAARLFEEAAELAERAGRDEEAAEYLARSVEISTRMGGISGGAPVADVVPLLERARRLAPEPGLGLRTRFVLDDAWVAWRTSEHERMAGATAEALGLARELGDPTVLSSALDAASALAWREGRFDDATLHSRERIEVLQPSQDSPGPLTLELSDAYNMVVESLLQAGELRKAAEVADEHAGMITLAPHISEIHSLSPLYLLGEWDEVRHRGERTRAAWLADGRPPVAFFTPGFAAVAAVHGMRGELAEQRGWAKFAEETARGGEQLPGVRARLSEVALQFGDLDGALVLLDLEVTNFWLPLVLARRAEATALGGDRPGALRLVERAEGELADAFTAAVIARSKGLAGDDDACLVRAAESFERMGCVYELARTQSLRGADHAQAARATFARLGIVAQE